MTCELIVSTLAYGSGHLLLPGVLAWMRAFQAWMATSEVLGGLLLLMAGMRLAARSGPAVGSMLAVVCCFLLAALGCVRLVAPGCMRTAGNHWSSTELVMQPFGGQAYGFWLVG